MQTCNKRFPARFPTKSCCPLLYSVRDTWNGLKLPLYCCIDGHLFELRERGKYAIYGGMFSGFAALRLVSHGSACDCAR